MHKWHSHWKGSSNKTEAGQTIPHRCRIYWDWTDNSHPLPLTDISLRTEGGYPQLPGCIKWGSCGFNDPCRAHTSRRLSRDDPAEIIECAKETAAAVIWENVTSIIRRLSEVIPLSKYVLHCWRPSSDRQAFNTLYKERGEQEKEERACTTHNLHTFYSEIISWTSD